MGKIFHCGISIENFDPEEFFCPCCNRERMDPYSLIRIEAWRLDYGNPTSVAKGGGWRCSDYDHTYSAHKDGQGIDALYPRSDHALLVKLAYKHGFTGIGDKCTREGYQLHLDDALPIPGKRVRPWKWTYQ